MRQNEKLVKLSPTQRFRLDSFQPLKDTGGRGVLDHPVIKPPHSCEQRPELGAHPGSCGRARHGCGPGLKFLLGCLLEPGYCRSISLGIRSCARLATTVPSPASTV